MVNKKHDSPYDRGSCDYYYGRPFNPHYYNPNCSRIEMDQMTDQEIEEYRQGYEQETGRKNDTNR